MYVVDLWKTRSGLTTFRRLGEYPTWREAKERAAIYVRRERLGGGDWEDPEIGDDDWWIWGPGDWALVVKACDGDHPHEPWSPGGEFEPGWELRYPPKDEDAERGRLFHSYGPLRSALAS